MECNRTKRHDLWYLANASRNRFWTVFPSGLHRTIVSRIHGSSNILSEHCNEVHLLALAAEVRCPGATSWVPDFSEALRPISVIVPNALTEPSLSVSPPNPHSLLYLQTLHTPIVTCCNIQKSVFDFVNATCLSTDALEAGRIYNGSCIMETLRESDSLRPLEGTRNIHLGPSICISIIQAVFKSLSLNIDYSRLIRYCALVTKPMLLQDTPLQPFGMVKPR
jgi:hypothetical protein